MEDDEETLKVSLQEVDDSRMEHKPLETEELTNTEQCEPVPELDDSQLVAAKLPIATKDDQAVVEEVEIPEAGTEIETGTESEDAEGGGQQSIPESDDLQLVGAESPIVAKDYEDVEAVAEDENQTADTEMETEAEAAKGSGGDSVPLFDDARFVGAESSIAAKDDEDDEAVAEEENPDTEIETETESEVAKGSGGESIPELEDAHLVGAESPIIAKDDDDEEVVAEDEIQMVDTKMEIEDAVEMAEAEKGDGGGGGKRKRGRISRVPSKAPARKAIGDDVCFICFDGGELVLCDRRGCPKAYHPSCVNRDEAFFRAKGRWNCGWHLCSSCEKNAYYMCYTCTFSLCKGCIKDAVILCVRGNKGFCETCMKTVMLIENNEQGNKEAQVDFDDKSSWEYLFKDYWIDLKAKLSLSLDELAQARNPWKGSDVLAGKQESPEELYDANNDGDSGSDSSENLEASKPKKRKAKKRSKSLTKEEDLPSAAVANGAEGSSTPGNTEWASKELLEFVMHMKNGDKSVLSQFDVQALLLEYIKRNKLRDPRRKSQIICDLRLENLFGKARVGHFEMLKLLESHFLIKEDSQIDDIQGTVVDTDVNQLDADDAIKGGKDKRRKTRKKGDDRGPQSNLDDYAAIDIHNINLIYLRRKLMEDLLEDFDKFHDKVVGTFVRIRISGSNQKQDMYRLVQVVGTSKAAEPYKIGKRTTDIMLEILNLSKTEVISIDTISNQEFTEDECKRLRQSIKCGLINRLTVGDILEKATEVQAARVNDWLETEIVRLSHLRDRASEKGRRKELRECVEKLQLLKTPEERRRRLEEIPEIHADPNMDPSFESEDDDSETEDNRREIYIRPRGSGFGRKGREPISPRAGSFSSKDSWSGARKDSKNWELNRNTSNKNLLDTGEEASLVGELQNENAWNQGRDKDAQQSNNLEKLNSATSSETVGWNGHSVVRAESFSGVASETSSASLSAGLAETATKISETDKMWHYQDPSGKIQGPFSVVQLRKWSNNGYFPADLRIWRTTEKQDDSILLTDALAGRFQKELPQMDNSFTKVQTVLSPHLSSTHAGKSYGTSLQTSELSSSGWSTPSVEVSKLSTDRWGSDYGSRNDSVNLPSPTPKQSTPGWTGGQASENKWSTSSFPVQQAGSVLGTSSFPGGNGALQSPAVATPVNGQFSRSSTLSSSINPGGSKQHNTVQSLGVLAPTAVLNSGGQLARGSERDSSSSYSGLSPTPNSEQVFLVGSTNALPTSQSAMTGESHGVHHSVETHGWGSGSVPKTEMVAPSTTPRSESQAWGSAPSQKLEPNSSIPGQPAAYGQLGGVPSTVQNPAGNFPTAGFSALPPPDPWRPPVPGNQSNIQPPAPPSVPWGVAENNTFAPGPRPDNPNSGWGLPGNPNMGWGGPAPGSTNINWGATVQGPAPGNANVGWVMPTGNQGPVPGNVNPGWVVPTGNPGAIVQGLPPGNANPGWGTPTGNPGATVPPGNGNPVWVAPTGNPGATVQGPPGNANPGWGAPAGNPGMWGSEQQRNGDRFSGQRDRGSQGGDSGFGGGRPWNRQSSFGRGGQGGSSRSLLRGQRVCVYHESGHCKKGASCDYLHT
uniref:Putative zinc finger CCCH domain-containing protein 19-like n=1 Tax=Davidia involucrata TaxID=16924 RepID=A0A5B7BZQ5_DAVIN